MSTYRKALMNIRAAGTVPARCWIVVMPQDAIAAAVAGGYVEVNHGKAGPLERMRPHDGIACYSPRASDRRGQPLQAFTALGRVDDAPMTQLPLEHQPFRRAVGWLAATPASVRPLIASLGFIRNKAHWGTAFRFGYLRVPPGDFALIAAAMQCPWSEPAQAAAARSPALEATGVAP
jgi:hypothetical protein